MSGWSGGAQKGGGGSLSLSLLFTAGYVVGPGGDPIVFLFSGEGGSPLFLFRGKKNGGPMVKGSVPGPKGRGLFFSSKRYLGAGGGGGAPAPGGGGGPGGPGRGSLGGFPRWGFLRGERKKKKKKPGGRFSFSRGTCKKKWLAQFGGAPGRATPGAGPAPRGEKTGAPLFFGGQKPAAGGEG